jgi:hypothetical protein
MKRINWPILITIICVVLFMGVFWYGFKTGTFTFLQRKNQTQKQNEVQTKEEVKVIRTDYTDVARKTLDWIDKQRNETKEIPIIGKICPKNGCKLENKDDLIVTWVRLNYYEQHKNSRDLEIIKEDINIFYDKYKNHDLSGSLWLCKIAYEMNQNKNIDDIQKDKLKDLCFKTKEITVDEIEKYSKEINLTSPQAILNDDSIYVGYYNSFFGKITNLVYKYIWSGDDKYEDLIKKYILAGEDLVLKDKIREPQDFCMFGLSIMDVWKFVDKSETRLDYVINLYQKNGNDDFLSSSVCGLLVKDLYQASKETSFLEKLELYNKKIAVENLNDKNKSGFINSGYVDNSVGQIRNIIEDALMVELLR